MIGKILLASNIHPDSHLYSKVILVIYNSDDGSIALTLNNGNKGGISDVDNTYCIVEGLSYELQDAVKISDTKQLILNDDIDVNHNSLYFFQGCEKWGPRQLETELEMNAWEEISDINMETLSKFDFFSPKTNNRLIN